MTTQRPPVAPWRQRLPAAPWPLNERGSVCHHEAGHLVAARLVGFTPGNAVASQEKGGRATIGINGAPPQVEDEAIEQPMPPAEMYARAFDQTWPGSWGGRSYEKAGLDYCTVVVAGRQAELIHAGADVSEPCVFPLGDHDHRVATAILHLVGESAALGWCQKRARDLLAANWQEVERQAEMIRQGTNTTGGHHAPHHRTSP